MALIIVQKLGVLINLPENALAIERARNNSVLGVGVQAKNIAVVAIVSVHVAHFSHAPDLEGAVRRHRVKLVVLFVEADILRGEGWLRLGLLTVMESR